MIVVVVSSPPIYSLTFIGYTGRTWCRVRYEADVYVGTMRGHRKVRRSRVAADINISVCSPGRKTGVGIGTICRNAGR